MNVLNRWSIALLAGIVLLPVLAGAATPDLRPLDRRFGDRGVASLRFDTSQLSDEYLVAADIDSQGRIVLAGTMASPHPERRRRIAVARLLADGHLDPTFGIDGRYVSDCPLRCETLQLAVMPDDRIILAVNWRIAIGNEDIRLIRLSADGRGLDEWVNGQPDTYYRVSGQSWEGRALGPADRIRLRVLPPDKLVLVVPLQRAGLLGPTTGVMRFNGQRQPDTTFNPGGEMPGRRVLEESIEPDAVVVLSGGRTIVAGATWPPPGATEIFRMLGVWSLRDDGSNDPEFGVNGLKAYQGVTSTAGPRVPAMAVTQWVIGTSVGQQTALLVKAPDHSFRLLRLDRHGEPAPSTDPGGWTTLPLTGLPGLQLVDMMPNRIRPGPLPPTAFPPSHFTMVGLVEGGIYTHHHALISQVRADGSLEPGFADGGIAAFIPGYVPWSGQNAQLQVLRPIGNGMALAADTTRIDRLVDIEHEAGNGIAPAAAPTGGTFITTYEFNAYRLVLDRIFAGDQEDD